jgi:hypothetical protein
MNTLLGPERTTRANPWRLVTGCGWLWSWWLVVVVSVPGILLCIYRGLWAGWCAWVGDGLVVG